MEKLTKINRYDLPIQSLIDLNFNNLAVVPINRRLFDLPSGDKINYNIIKEITPEVIESYNKDMDSVEAIAKVNKYTPFWLEEYRRFNKNWYLESIVGDYGYLNLFVQTEKTLTKIKICEYPQIFSNYKDDFGKYLDHSITFDNKNFDIICRYSWIDHLIFMNPAKMDEYGVKIPVSDSYKDTIYPVKGLAFISNLEKPDNLGISILLRNYAVAYLNKLLDKLPKSPIPYGS